MRERPGGQEDPLEKGKATHSGLENSMDCTVYGVAKSRPRLSDFHFRSSLLRLGFLSLRESRGYSLVAVCRLLIAVAFPVVDHGL